MNLETGDFPGPFITISRQAGCSAKRIAIKLSKILTGYSYMADTKTDAEWKWVNKDIFSQIVREMIDEVISGAYDNKNGDGVQFLKTVDKAFADETLYDITDNNLIRTLKGIICRLACQGRTIIVGRSAGALLKNVPNKLNIRLEAPLDWRINRIMQMNDISRARAEKYITEMDEKRDSFIEKVIGRKAENNDFDVIFNYASLEDDLIIDAVVNILRHKQIVAPYSEY
ncbi:MAG: AAA family ATPase [Draconibacterium sp.]